ncbi:hypothetical protein [Chondrinema litorale]|uniref:hypothetical protein n=1 Tax=Chondrinema litorale TaxID=2994555 RepID=UPI002542D8E0|nr:hypothetical protein [Chondrinema litorale]UZR97131.1 hypothetical protein OQ292_23830 [Chondrinema litorale]
MFSISYNKDEVEKMKVDNHLLKVEASKMLDDLESDFYEKNYSSNDFISYDENFLSHTTSYKDKAQQNDTWINRYLHRIINSEDVEEWEYTNFFELLLFKKCSTYFSDAWFLLPYFNISYWFTDYICMNNPRAETLFSYGVNGNYSLSHNYYLLDKKDIISLYQSFSFEEEMGDNSFSKEQATYYKNALDGALNEDIYIFYRVTHLNLSV